jgi:hypothetical protein
MAKRSKLDDLDLDFARTKASSLFGSAQRPTDEGIDGTSPGQGEPDLDELSDEELLLDDSHWNSNE